MDSKSVGPSGPTSPSQDEWVLLEAELAAASRSMQNWKEPEHEPSSGLDEDWVLVEPGADPDTKALGPAQEQATYQRRDTIKHPVRPNEFIVSFREAHEFAEGKPQAAEYERFIVLNWSKFLVHVVMKSKHWPKEFDTWHMVNELAYARVTLSKGSAEREMLYHDKLFKCMCRYGLRGRVRVGRLVFEPYDIGEVRLSTDELEEYQGLDWAREGKAPIPLRPQKHRQWWDR